MTARRALAALLVVLVAVMVAGPLLPAGDCDDGCLPDCGDCLGCGLVVDHVAVPALAHLQGGLLESSLPPPPSSSALDELDHVPLSAVA